jgi:hypothetical protein
LNEYAGTYENELYGAITISVDKKSLLVKFNGHKELTASLQYMEVRVNEFLGIRSIYFVKKGLMQEESIKTKDPVKMRVFCFKAVNSKPNAFKKVFQQVV